MGLESVVSIIPTIGNVLGTLLGGLFGEGENAPLRKYSFKVGSSPMDQIDISNDKGELNLCNLMRNESVCVSFPARNGNDAETAIVPPRGGCLPLNDLFKSCAENDVDSFEITVADSNAVRKDLFADEKVLSISAGGIVKVNDKVGKLIGVYTQATITGSEISIRQVNGTGKGEIVNLYLQSVAGSGSFFIHDLVMDENNSATASHPLILKDGEEVHVSVTINYVPRSHSDYMQENNKRYGIRQMSQQEMALLSNAICVNRKV